MNPAAAAAETGLELPFAAPVAVSRALALGFRAMPWVSLGFGVGGAIFMDRSAGRAWLVAVAGLLGWGALAGLLLLNRIETERLPRLRALAVKAARFASVTANQNLLQLALLFSLPFYFRAAVWAPGHFAFLLVVTAVAAVSLWDPLSEALLRRPVAGLPLQAIASFAGLNAVLPMLGLSNRGSLWLAALLTALGLPLTIAGIAPRGRRVRDTSIALLAALGVPLALLLGAGSLVPAAPLRIVAAGIGTGIADRELTGAAEAFEGVPPKLYCYTAIGAPAGLHDALFHVWRREGEPSDRIALTVTGGREQGFRTWSSKSGFGPQPVGEWSCTVETASGQVLGRRTIEITAAP